MLSMKSRMMKIFTSSDSCEMKISLEEDETLSDLKLNFLMICSVEELVDYFPSLISFFNEISSFSV